MPADVIVGLHFGDEGKGKVVDYLLSSPRHDQYTVVGRYNGGPNAGHTVMHGGETYKLHQIPSGILHEGTIFVLGCGVVINTDELFEEIVDLENNGIKITPDNLLISSRAHVILPDCIKQDREEGRRLGTTGQGIGPTYSKKYARTGVRIGEYLNEKNAVRTEAELSLKQFVKDTEEFILAALKRGEYILAEGAQGTFLDIDLGDYPFVTSSHTTAGGACTGLGIPPTEIEEVMGVAKICMSRVGEGPFPTELGDYQTLKNDKEEILSGDLTYTEMTQGELSLAEIDNYQKGRLLRRRGFEWGTTTGRPRRLGWPDWVLTKRAVEINGVTKMAITKADVFNGMPVKARIGESGPSYTRNFLWQTVVKENEGRIYLDEEFSRFKREMEEVVGAPITVVSYGPAREQTWV